ncbi:MAG: hypothetical protein P8O16_17700 [Algoriphagus sp.]|uniref:hypothetical protein n=1 Tax=Algoriphagus sp. TaxID=1872435 RepID=UPI002639EAAC|nr:hypothetical protein [Algoriphagus sp.]MDG1279119.1 hypothetical protein [Algoriphagus sp.]
MLSSESGEEDILPSPPSSENPFEGYSTYSVQVKFPEGSAPDLTDAKILSWDKLSSLDEDEVVKVIIFPDEPAFAYLFDKEDRLLLAGLID